MSGYAVAASLTGSRILLGPSLRPRSDICTRHALELFDVEARPDPIDEPPATSIADRVHYVRQAWSQTTFYLLDLEGWR